LKTQRDASRQLMCEWYWLAKQ